MLRRVLTRESRLAARAATAAAREARRLRARCARSALRVLPVATIEELVVQDGVSLNVRVRLPRSAGPRPITVHLVLTRDGHEHSVRLHRDGPRSAATALNLATLAGPGPGRWLLHLRLRHVDGGASRHPVYGPPPRRPSGGPTRAAARCPDTGTGYVLGATTRGRTSLTLTPATPRAQVTRVVTGWDGVTVSGRLIAAGRPGPAVVEMVHRDGRTRLPVVLGEGRFTFTVPGEAIAAAPEWRFTLAVDGAPALPVGRYLDGLRRPDRSIRYPARLIHTAAGRPPLRVRPRYSARGRLLLTRSVPEETA
ncbi:hypothetical protein [Actinomadura xylanilytica]|uniref:hypothetical protein n=1 Tax=Actinomadura xylanilytica TaxID=887459 RepID=UPI00255B16C2|nr:hypothetical protein [Actinomadura xylanilytica]MDL4773222.1 hypothetical protein [Actinomadura xylanilytica]